MATEIVVDEAAMHELLQSPTGPVGHFIAKTGEKVETVAKRKVAVGETHALQESIESSLVVDEDGFYARVGSDREEAIYVEYGTGIYGTGPGATHERITAKDGGVLHFVVDGREFFLKSVAGQREQPFLRPALREVMETI